MNPLSRIVRTVCNATAWLILVFGLYVIIHGHITPGGGFQGGAVVASFVGILMAAHGGKLFHKWIDKDLLNYFETTGLLLFLLAGFIGIGTTFFYNSLANSGLLFGSPVPIGPNSGVLNSSGTIAMMNLSVGLEVIGGLSLVLLYMSKGISLYDEETERSERGYDR